MKSFLVVATLVGTLSSGANGTQSVEVGVEKARSSNDASISTTAELMSSNWACGCNGGCENGTNVGATGSGFSIASAISACEQSLYLACMANGGLQSYFGTNCIEL